MYEPKRLTKDVTLPDGRELRIFAIEETKDRGRWVIPNPDKKARVSIDYNLVTPAVPAPKAEDFNEEHANTIRGKNKELDTAWDKHNKSLIAAYRALIDEIRPLIPEYDLGHLSWSRTAGCSCGCSPAFISDTLKGWYISISRKPTEEEEEKRRVEAETRKRVEELREAVKKLRDEIFNKVSWGYSEDQLNLLRETLETLKTQLS